MMFNSMEFCGAACATCSSGKCQGAQFKIICRRHLILFHDFDSPCFSKACGKIGKHGVLLYFNVENEGFHKIIRITINISLKSALILKNVFNLPNKYGNAEYISLSCKNTILCLVVESTQADIRRLTLLIRVPLLFNQEGNYCCPIINC